MNTRRLYYEMPYETVFDGTVLECHEEKGMFIVVLDRTLFYPEGGGQPADKGTLGGAEVLDVKEKEGIVYHKVNKPLVEGLQVQGKIDWAYRFDLMRHHTGEHIISGIISEKWKYQNVGFHMGRECITLDVSGKLSKEDVKWIEQKANQAAASNIAVNETWYSSEEVQKMEYRSKKELSGDVRLVEVPGYDVCACCGLHVANTGEIGLIKILSADSYKGGTRMSMVCGDRAYADYSEKCENANAISQMISAPTSQIAKAVEMLMTERDQYQYKLAALQRKMLEGKAETLEEGMEKAVIFEEGLATRELRYFCNLVGEKCSQFAAVFSGTDEEGYTFMLTGKGQDIRPIAAKMQQALGGKGGGSKELVQGKTNASREQIEEYFRQI